jgi:hypothetical protein
MFSAMPSSQRETHPNAPPITTAKNEIDEFILVQITPRDVRAD